MQNIIVDEQLSAKETEEIKTKARKIFDKVKKIKEKMDNDQKEIEQIRHRTRAVLEQLEKAA